MSDAEKAVKVEGILNQIIAVNATLQVSFPIHRSASSEVGTSGPYDTLTSAACIAVYVVLLVGMMAEWR